VPIKTYKWDAEAKLKSVNNPDQTEPCPTGAIVCYKYNALGQMVQFTAVSPSRVRNFVYSPSGQELGQYTSGGYTAWDDQYVPLGGRQIAKYYGGSLTDFVHPNHLGSTSIVTDQTGTPVRDMLFYPWGQTWRQLGNNYDSHFAAFQQREFNSGLDPTPNRMYHSRLFRWMTPDEFTGGPVSAYGPPDPAPPGALPYADITNPQSLNKYAYVYNNPLRYNDPTGRFCLKAIWGGNCNDDRPPSIVKPRPEVSKQALGEALKSYRPAGGKETVATIAGRVRNEFMGMKDSTKANEPLSAAENKVAHQRLNAIQKYGDNVQGRSGMMKPLIDNSPQYQQALEATASAVWEDAGGSDPTNGAYQFNMRKTMSDTNDFLGAELHTQSGPYESVTPYKVVNTYGD
jgi:RHS repeat-associated protein